ncbi:MAG: GyrI-like domain-containing protein [Minicystis sp.]
MLETPEIIQYAAQRTAAVHVTIPRNQIREVMGPGIGEVMSAATAQGIGPTGPWLCHHLKADPDTFDFRISVPVNGPVTPVGRVAEATLPAAKVARAVYQGPYEGLGAAWGELMAWIAANGHTPGPDFWEVYLKGPETGLDASTYRTELNRPLVG